MRLRLRAIRYGCDFRKNEVTLMQECLSDRKFKQLGSLINGEVVLLVSRTENQLIWLFASPELTDQHGEPLAVIDSRRARLPRSGWNPQLLGNYAKAVGIELAGIQNFEHAYLREREERRKMRLDEAYEYKPHMHISLDMGKR